MKIKSEYRGRLSLTLMFASVIFFILIISILIAGLIVYILVEFFWEIEDILDIKGVLLIMSLISLIVGTGLTTIVVKIPLKPINNIINQMNRLACGDYKARLSFGGLIGAHPAFIETSESFNKMAEELENTEMLRSDFINNFSHEFKTPIVSIAGFAKLLKRGNLSDEQKAEYIDVIEEEAMRLSYIATNVMNLTKVENQSILTNVTKFNLSEQIRSAVLLLENKWSKKNLDLNLDFREVYIYANEEMLKQVWINLIDNAIKFSEENGRITLRITEESDSVNVTVINSGNIPEQSVDKIWRKFYQADESHSSEGNGIGLAIVKRIIDLHSGEVLVRSGSGVVVFEVKLPKNRK